jgi:hypothetical protein
MKTQILSSNRYNITWIEFRPEFGIATKADVKKISGLSQVHFRYSCHVCDIHTGCYYKWFASKEKAVEFLQNFDKKLSKRYECRLFTDKQFGDRNEKDNYKVAFTKKQMDEVYYI